MLKPFMSTTPRIIGVARFFRFLSRKTSGGWVDTVTPDWVMVDLLRQNTMRAPAQSVALARAERPSDRLTVRSRNHQMMVQ